MSEQQRVLTTVILCFGIWFGWQVYFGEPPSAPMPPAAIEPDEAARPAGTSAAPGASAPGQASVGPSTLAAAPLAYAVRSVRVPLYRARLRNNDAAFERLLLPAFAAFRSTGDTNDAGDANDVPGESMVSDRLGRQASLAVRFGDILVPLAFVASAEEGDRAPVRFAGTWGAGGGNGRDEANVALSVAARPDAYAWDYRLTVQSGAKALPAGEVELMLQLTPLPEDQAEGRSGLLPIGNGERIDLPSAVYVAGEKIFRKKPADLPQSLMPVDPAVTWAGLETQYFLLAWLPDAGSKSHIRVTPRPQGGVAIAAMHPIAEVAPRGRAEVAFSLYAGPKRDSELTAVDARLAQVVDYNILGLPMGFLARPAMWLLREFYRLTHSWGIAILLITVVVKLLLLPASAVSAVKIKRVQKLKPQLDVLQKRYKDDPQRLSSETFALYKEHNANPLMGCLPMLLQLPVWLAFYRALASAVDLYRQPFMWISDLHLKEPFPFLALAVGGLTLLQQRLTPMGGDTQQARVMMWMMPILVPAFMVNLPAGLVLYIVINSTLTIFQQLAINRFAA